MSRPSIHVIARALIQVESHLLIAHCKGAANSFLPSGHVDFGEAVRDAITRELQEELGVACRVGDYVGAIEHSFTESYGTQHEINHIFEVELCNVAGLAPLISCEDHLEFFWHPTSRLHEINLQPQPVVELARTGGRRPLWASTLRVARRAEQRARCVSVEPVWEGARRPARSNVSRTLTGFRLAFRADHCCSISVVVIPSEDQGR